MLASPISQVPAPGASEEAVRLNVLHSYEILDSLPERAFDELTQLAAQLCGTPIAGLTLLDEDRQWFKSVVGLNFRETPRGIALSDHVVRGGVPLIVPDATLDPRFATNPQVTGDPHIRFYAAVPLISGGGHAIGAIAVLDRTPRQLEAGQLRALQMVANQIIDQLDLRLNRIRLEDAVKDKDRLRIQLIQDRAHLYEAQRMAGVGSWHRTLTDNRLTWTDEVFRIFGYPPDAIRPSFEVFLNHVHPGDRESLIAARDKTLRDGDPLDIEHRIVRADGSIRLVHERAELVFDSSGKPVAMAGAVLDITERNAGHIAVRESERRYREIVQASPDLIFVQQGGKITFINDAGMRLLRATFVEQVLGRSFLELVHPDFQEAARQRLDWLLEAPRAAPVIEKKFVALDGAVIDVEMRAVSFPSGDHLAIQVTCRDITDHLRTQAALRASEQRLRQTLDALPMAAYTCNADGLITYYNEKALEVWGRTPRLNSDTDRYCGCFRQLRPDGRPVPHNESWTAMTLAKKRAFSGGEVIMMRPDGSQRHVTAHTNPFFDADGVLVGAVNVLMDVTEWRQAQAALQESEERFRTVAKAATDAIWDWNILADTIWWSDGIQTLFGYSPDRIPGDCHSWTARIHPDDQKRVVEDIFSTIEDGRQHWEQEYHFQRSDGSYAYVLDRGFVIRDAAGKAVRMVGGMTDLSERRRIEEHLQESEANFRELAENIDAVFYNRDVANNRLLYISPAYERIWGRSCESAYGNADSYFDAIYPRDSDLVCEAQERLAAGEETDIEYRIITAAGDLKWIRDHSYPVFNARGHVERIVGTARDVTERKQVDQRIVEQAELLDKAHDAILVHDLDHRVTYWNKSAERLYGWRADEVVGRPVAHLLNSNAPDFVQAAQLLLENGEWSGELQQTSKDGADITVEARWTLVRDTYGQPQAVFAIHTDITERKRMEAQFLRAQRMESLGTLAGGIAHDLNNVLAPIMMSIDLLKLSSRNGNDDAVLSTIEMSARRGAEMVQQVLSFARGVEGRRLMIDPADVLGEVQHMIHETFPKNIEFRARLTSGLPSFIGDPTQVHQVLINLCVNARDAMPNGGRLELSAETVKVDAYYAALNPNARPGNYVVIKVVDDGTGIPREIRDKVFDPFFTTKELGKGTGLGLSTVLAIVKSHGGFVHVESEPGRGSTFLVHFPALLDRPEARTALLKEMHPRGRGELVLVVDDEESVRLITRQTLEAFGYRVMTACDGAEAVALYAQHRHSINVVFTDIMMPIMDGPSAIQVLLRMNPQLRIIAASGLNSHGSAFMAADMGVRHFLPKPYTAQTLLWTLKELMDEAPECAACLG